MARIYCCGCQSRGDLQKLHSRPRRDRVSRAHAASTKYIKTLRVANEVIPFFDCHVEREEDDMKELEEINLLLKV